MAKNSITVTLEPSEDLASLLNKLANALEEAPGSVYTLGPQEEEEEESDDGRAPKTITISYTLKESDRFSASSKICIPSIYKSLSCFMISLASQRWCGQYYYDPRDFVPNQLYFIDSWLFYRCVVKTEDVIILERS